MVILINLLVVVVMIVLSLFFYQQFKQALNERVLLQLTSIKRLKRVQIEDYIQTEWNNFQSDTLNLKLFVSSGTFAPSIKRSLDTKCLETKSLLDTEGIVDLSHCTVDSTILLAMVKKYNDSLWIRYLDQQRIQHILLERSGMGETGETYLVGDDFHLRSRSRFFPNQKPLSIQARTEGVENSLAGNFGSNIIKDYRGVPVFSAYHQLDLPGINWVILSEIDVKEATIPLAKMRTKLAAIFVLVTVLAMTLSLVLTSFFSKPLLQMRDLLTLMSKGNFDFKVVASNPSVEFQEMFSALDELKQSIQQAIRFSNEIGALNLKTTYPSNPQEDQLGKAMILMQERLKDYEHREKQNQLLAKKSLILGQEKERKRLSKELHDGLGPLLTSLKLNIQRTDVAPHVKTKLNQVIDQTIQEIRRMTYDLMPPALEDFGVGKAMSNFVNMISKSSGIPIIFEDDTLSVDSKIGSDVDVCLFRICQELINNSLKHANCSKIAITLTEFEDKVSLFYFDDGKGFNTQEVKKGSGLRNIKERVAVFDGYVEVSSSQEGTQVEVEIPFS